jgi:hypothetical protein
MDYALAKQLKAVGYPQEGLMRFMVWENPADETNDNKAYAPALEELIEACIKRPGNFLKNLVYYPDAPNGPEWGAFLQLYKEKEGQGIAGVGSTPTEAVANLYISLHKVQ